MNIVKKRKLFIFLLALFIIFFLVRVWHINSDLLFHRDQGLHSLAIWNIWHEKKLSLLGHPSDVNGLTHAPIYYWLMAPAYVISNGDPAFASIFQIFLETLSLPFLYLALKKFFDKKVAVFTLIFYTFSYGLVSLSRWLINVNPILPFSNLFIYLLSRQLDRKYTFKFLFLTSLTVGIISQLNAAVGVFLIPFLIWFYRKEINIKNVFGISAGILIPASPLILFQFRHNFVLVHALVDFIKTPQKGLGLSTMIFQNFFIFLEQITNIFAFPFSLISAILFVWGLISLRKNRYKTILFALLIIPVLGLGFFKRGAIGFFFIDLMPISLAIIISGLRSFPNKLFYIVFGLFIILNIYNLKNIYKPTNALIPIGNSNLITLQDRKNIVDWIYSKSEGKNFSLYFYTIPYFQEDVWNYVLNYYALPKYGYLPEKTHGFSPSELISSQHFFAVYEPDYDKPDYLNGWLNEIETKFGEVKDAYQSHDLHVDLTTWENPKSK